MIGSNVTVIKGSRDSLQAAADEIIKRKKVAAYARVSTEQDEQLNSYEAQVNYYTHYIQANPAWDFAGIYADEGITGTNTRLRDGFNRMIADAKDGKIDIILTKSISRFARNTVDTLNTVRELQQLGVEVRFEKENINTLDKQSEVLLTIMSSLAQEESRSISENVRWGQQRSMQSGKIQMAYSSFLGYRKGEDGKPEIVPEEAGIVRDIYAWYLDGMSQNQIAQKLTEQGIPTPRGNRVWRVSTVRSILSNEKYKGDCIRQKTYTENYLDKKVKKNNGEVDQYYIHNSHPAIIDEKTFGLVQERLSGRGNNSANGTHYTFSGKVFCECCGQSFRRKGFSDNRKTRKPFWYCANRYTKENPCPAPIVHEEELKQLYKQLLEQLLASPDFRCEQEKTTRKLTEQLSATTSRRKKTEAKLETLVAKMQALVKENARVSQNQEEYKERYDELYEKTRELKDAVSELLDKEQKLSARITDHERFVKAIENASSDTFLNPEVYEKILDRIVVQNTDEVEFVLRNGRQVCLPLE